MALSEVQQESKPCGSSHMMRIGVIWELKNKAWVASMDMLKMGRLCLSLIHFG